MADQLNMFDDEREYHAFVEKFKPKRTTDDCYTPENIYRAVAEWVSEEYGVDTGVMIRPFWPGGDYEREEYPEGCAVVDNPPFSILTRIMRFYCARGVRFFLFAPTLTLFSGRVIDVCYVPCGVKITYANGANVNTSFVTNMDQRRLRTCPRLYRAIKVENDRNEKAMTKTLPKYSFPAHVLTAASAYQLSRCGVDFSVDKGDAVFISNLDAMKRMGKDSGIFGGALLLSQRAAAERAAAERAAAERAAAERAAAERADAHVWELSPREWEIVRGLGDAGEPAGPWFYFGDEGGGEDGEAISAGAD